MSKANQLNALSFPLHGSRLIEASAGTGKTYTIAALYLRLVLQHGGESERFHASLRPQDILVVTFTNAATEELRDRIRARLAEAAAYFRGEVDSSGVDEFLQDLRASYHSEKARWPEYAYRLDMASQAMDEAAVSTIHGWCNRMLREHAFASGSLFTQSLEGDQDEMKLTACQDYWRTWLYELEPEPYAFYKSQFSSPDNLKYAIDKSLPAGMRAVRTPDQIIADYFADYQQLLASAGLNDRTEIDAAFAALLDAQQQGSFNGNKVRKQTLPAMKAAILEWLTGASASRPLPEMTDAQFAKLRPEGLTASLKSGAQLEVPGYFDKFADFLDQLHLLQVPTGELTRHAWQWVKERVSQLQDMEAIMGYDDMLLRLRDALRKDDEGRLAAVIREQFPVAMIDEFQDTDPVQYEVFNRIYQLAENDNKLGIFLIGDPKQAIYSFRDADIFTYLQARRDTAGRHYTLGTNFRSTADMVNAVNAVFSPASEYKHGPFLFRNENNEDEVPFNPVNAKGLRYKFVRQDQDATALQVRYHRNEKADLTEVADDFAEEIVTILNDAQAGFVSLECESDFRRVQPGDIAVLVNDVTEASKIKSALSTRNVKSVYLSDRQSVFGGLVGRELLLILDAMAYPRDASRVKAALATRLLDLPLRALLDMNENENIWEDLADRFIAYHDLWQYSGVLAALHRLLHEFRIPAKLKGKDDGERLLTDVMHIAELLQQHSLHTEGMSGLLRYLSQRVEENTDNRDGSSARTNSEEQQVRLESDDQLVQIITIHKSKGLQYPLVFLPFVSQVPKRVTEIKPPVKYHDQSEKLQVLWDEPGEAVKTSVLKERLGEDIRKFYVAVTRAQFATFVGVANFKRLGHSGVGYLLTGQGPLSDITLSEGDLAEKLQHQAIELVACDSAVEETPYYPVHQETPELKAREFPNSRQLEKWWLSSYSALKYGELNTADTADDDNLRQEHAEQQERIEIPVKDVEPVGIHAFPKGPVEGTFLHNLLEDAAGEGFAALSASQQLVDVFVEERTEQAPWSEYRQILKSWLANYLQTSFRLGNEKFSLDTLVTYRAEPEFWFPAHHVSAEALDQLVCRFVIPEQRRPRLLANQLNGMLKGFIDLVFEHNGKYYVADYKSNWIGPQDSDYTKESMEQKILHSRYDLQFVIYTLALHKLLKTRLGEQYDYDTHVGGAVYLFFRGNLGPERGAYFYRPDRELIEQLDVLFDGQEGSGND